MANLKKITEQDIETYGVVASPDTLIGTAAENKAEFDRLIRECVADVVNDAIDQIDSLETEIESKVDEETVYTKNESYSQTEIDNKLSNKADLNGDNTYTGNNTFAGEIEFGELVVDNANISMNANIGGSLNVVEGAKIDNQDNYTAPGLVVSHWPKLGEEQPCVRFESNNVEIAKLDHTGQLWKGNKKYVTETELDSKVDKYDANISGDLYVMQGAKIDNVDNWPKPGLEINHYPSLIEGETQPTVLYKCQGVETARMDHTGQLWKGDKKYVTETELETKADITDLSNKADLNEDNTYSGMNQFNGGMSVWSLDGVEISGSGPVPLTVNNTGDMPDNVSVQEWKADDYLAAKLTCDGQLWKGDKKYVTETELGTKANLTGGNNFSGTQIMNGDADIYGHAKLYNDLYVQNSAEINNEGYPYRPGLAVDNWPEEDMEGNLAPVALFKNKGVEVANLDHTGQLWKGDKKYVTETELDEKVDKVTGKGLSSNDYTNDEKSKLAGVTAGAEPNQNAISNVKVGDVTIAAASETDTVELAAGSGVTLSTDAQAKKITITADTGSGAEHADLADEAITLQTPRNINVSGALTAIAASFDGSADATINVTEVDGSKVTGLSDVAISGSYSDLTGIPAEATTSTAGLMSSADKSKLDGISAGAEENQNAVSKLKVGDITIAATTEMDTVELTAGSGVNLTADASAKKITITAETEGNVEHATLADNAVKLQTARNINVSGALSGTAASFDGSADVEINVTSVDGSKVTGLEDVYAPISHIHSNATQSQAGFMSAADKSKLDNISDETAQSILEKLKTVDGPDSGLDADMLDGKHASEFANNNHIHTNATSTSAGFMSAEDKSKMDGIEAGAEANTVDSVAGKTGAVTLSKSDVGLGNVDNTSDANKPVSTATQTALNNKVDKVDGKQLSTNDYTNTEKSKLAGIEAGAEQNTVDSVAGKTGAVTLSKSDVGLGNVDNTSDAQKPMSNPVRTEFGTLSNLQTTTKTNLVSAINEVKTGIKAGSYTGNGAATRKISLDFTPQAVIIMGGNGGNPDTNAMSMHANGIAVTGYPHQSTNKSNVNTTRFSVTTNGFNVYYDSSDGRGPNGSGYQYHYIAFR